MEMDWPILQSIVNAANRLSDMEKSEMDSASGHSQSVNASSLQERFNDQSAP